MEGVQLDKKEIIVYLTCAVLFVIGLVITAASIYYNLNKIPVGLAFAIPPLLFFIMKKRIIEKTKEVTSKTNNLLLLLIALFFITLSLSLLSWHSQNYTRPLIFFILMGISCVLIICQIMFYGIQKHVYVILLEILIIGLVLRASIYFEFPTVYGYDPFFHITGIQSIETQGFITSQLENYANFPYTHILASVIDQMTNVGAKAAYFTISIIEIIGALFIFIIAKKLTNTTIGLISALIIVVAPYNLNWGYWIIPMTLGLVFFIIVLYLLIVREEHQSIKISVLLLFFCFSSILVHTIASFAILVILLLLFACHLFYRFFVKTEDGGKKPFGSINLIILFGITLFSYWMFVYRSPGVDLFSSFIRSLVNSFSRMDMGAVGSVTLAPTYNAMSIFLRDLPFIILLFFALFGSMLLLNQKLDRKKFSWVFVGLAITLFLYGAGFLGISAVLPDRWFAFAEIILVIPAAYAIYLLVFIQTNRKRQVILSAVIIFIFAFSSITSPLNNGDNPLYAKELSERAGLLPSEVAAASFFYAHSNSTIIANSKYALIQGPPLNPENIRSYNLTNIIIRNYDIEKGFLIPFFGEEGKLVEIVYPDENFYEVLESSNKLYDNGQVKMFYIEGVKI